jgi:hypothetical protein
MPSTSSAMSPRRGGGSDRGGFAAGGLAAPLRDRLAAPLRDRLAVRLAVGGGALSSRSGGVSGSSGGGGATSRGFGYFTRPLRGGFAGSAGGGPSSCSAGFGGPANLPPCRGCNRALRCRAGLLEVAADATAPDGSDRARRRQSASNYQHLNEPPSAARSTRRRRNATSPSTPHRRRARGSGSTCQDGTVTASAAAARGATPYSGDSSPTHTTRSGACATGG